MNRKMTAAALGLAAQSLTFAAAAETPAPASSPSQSTDSSAAAQKPNQGSEDQPNVLLRSNTTLGGYGGPDLRVTSMLSEPAMLVGAQASWLAAHRFFFGVAGYGLATRLLAPEAMRIDGNRSTLGLVYGGLRLGVIATPNSLFHVTMAALTGMGNLTGISTVRTRGEFEVGYERQLGHAETFFVVEPEVAVEMNAASFMRVAAGASYRYVTGVEQPGLSSANLSGLAGSLALKFGVF